MTHVRLDWRRWVALLAALALSTLAALPADAATAPDRKRPRVSIDTEDGAVLISPTPAGGSQITGKASDNRGLRRVEIIYYSETDLVFMGWGMIGMTWAELSCKDGRRSCTWTTDAPWDAGEYSVQAIAVDRAGNRRKSKPVDVTVVGPPMVPFRR